MLSKAHNPAKMLKEFSAEAKKAHAHITEYELRRPKGEEGKKKITKFLDEVGFAKIKCTKKDCKLEGCEMKWRWRDCVFDPDTDYLLSGKIYNGCSFCESKRVYQFFPGVLAKS